MNNFRGLEILFTLCQPQLKSEEDYLMLALHSLLINKGNKCVGIGDSWAEQETDLSELLPESWNGNQEVYTLRYISNNDIKYVLKVVKMANNLLVNVFNTTDDKAAAISLNTQNYVNNGHSKFSEVFKNLGELGEKFTKEIIQAIRVKSDQKKADSKPDEDSTTASKAVPQSSLLEGYAKPSLEIHRQRIPFPQVGRGDLDPFHGGAGGGMLFDPSSMGFPSRPTVPPFGLPTGAVPPGARFDPIGPNIFGRDAFHPDPDNRPPPGFSDSFI